MRNTETHSDAHQPPDISFIVPAYNEEEILGATLRQLRDAFEQASVELELVVVDNGSSDRTGEIIAEFARTTPNVVPVRVEVNQGYGYGVLQAIPHATAPWIGIIPCDGQVDAADVAQLFVTVQGANSHTLAKVRRRFRMDGLRRKLVSVAYNLFVLALWPRIGSLDINGSPKILHRDVLRALDLQSKEWFLDAELMVKAHYLDVRVMEFNVFSRMRGAGISHVRASTCWEFFSKLLGFRFGRALPEWRRTVELAPSFIPAAAVPERSLEPAAG